MHGFHGLNAAFERLPAPVPAPPHAARLTAVVPAFNEASTLKATLRSLQNQTLPPDWVIVVDDCSADDTGSIARRCGATVLRPPSNTGSKAGAQTFALPFVRTEFVMVVDADTVLAPDAIEKALTAMHDPRVGAVCGFVLPSKVKTIWERGRYIEYLFAFTFFKPIQEYFERPMISSGCFSIYVTERVRYAGGWSSRTLAEDMDLTWTLYRLGYAVRFVPEAVCYPSEPHSFEFMSRQLRRWSHGFIQNVRLHWREVIREPVLSHIVFVAFWDALVATLAFLILIPMLALLIHPIILVGYVIDWPLIAVPVIWQGVLRGELSRAMLSLPCFYVLRIVNGYFFLNAAWRELVMRRPFRVYEKGH